MARCAKGLIALAAWSLAAAPAQAQVCLDCFTELLGANPFTAPVVLPGQAVGTLTLGLAGPVDSAAWLPNLQGKYGLVDGVEVAGTLGYEPSLGLRAVAASAGPVTLLGTARGGRRLLPPRVAGAGRSARALERRPRPDGAARAGHDGEPADRQPPDLRPGDLAAGWRRGRRSPSCSRPTT